MKNKLKNFPYIFQAEVVRWVDGDTVELVVDQGFKHYFGNTDSPISFRLLNVNTPEKYKVGGAEATAYVNELAPPGDFVIIRTYKIKDSDSFGRYLAEIYVDEVEFIFNAGPSISESLIASGHGVPYVKK